MRFGSLLGAIGLAAVKAEIKAASRRIAVAAISGFLILAAVCFGVAAFTVWLAGKIGTIWALLAVAGGFLLLALIVQGVARLASGRRRRAPRSPPPRPTAAPIEAPSANDAAVPPGSEIGTVAVVAIMGFLLARQISRQ